jgi:transcription elongation factor GreA
MSDQIPMTQEGFERKKEELAQLEKKMTEITKRVAEARAMGDLSENAEYHAAREDQGIQQAKIDQLKDKLSRAVIVDLSTLPENTVVFGAKVRIKDLDSGDEHVYHLVGPGEEDYENNKILTTSPRGQALLGRKLGDEVVVSVPRGNLRYEILDIEM